MLDIDAGRQVARRSISTPSRQNIASSIAGAGGIDLRLRSSASVRSLLLENGGARIRTKWRGEKERRKVADAVG